MRPPLSQDVHMRPDSAGKENRFNHAITRTGNPSRELHTSTATHEPGKDSKPRVLNLAEAAEFVRCSKAHLCNILNGKVRGIPQLPAVRVGRRVLFRRESLESWLIEVESSCSRRAIG